jgi:hypothetical protein
MDDYNEPGRPSITLIIDSTPPIVAITVSYASTVPDIFHA